ncbi:Rha family transcriptional regulator [Xanthobacter sp. TB0136]|uniref:Rha family transcriptional regulator n=1 Tax=Xanthobacter sp. TB0136 TaxID=3459177 RepID=UPI00403A0937
MSSREIAELLGNRHDNVKVTIERLVERGTIVQPAMQDEPGVDSMGRPRPVKVYLLDKRSSLIVVAQLSPEFTARVVDRWQELEAAVAAPPALPSDIVDMIRRTDGIVRMLAHKVTEADKKAAEQSKALAVLQEKVAPSVPGVFHAGKSPGYILKAAGYTGLPVNFAQWVGNRLADKGFQITAAGEDGGRLFDYAPSLAWIKKEGKATIERHLAERKGQGSLAIPGWDMRHIPRAQPDGKGLFVIGGEVITFDAMDTDLRRGDFILVALTNGNIEINEFGGDGGASVSERQELGPRMILSSWRALNASHQGMPRYKPHRYGGILIGKVIDRRPAQQAA